MKEHTRLEAEIKKLNASSSWHFWKYKHVLFLYFIAYIVYSLCVYTCAFAGHYYWVLASFYILLRNLILMYTSFALEHCEFVGMMTPKYPVSKVLTME